MPDMVKASDNTLILERYCYSDVQGTFGKICGLPFDCFIVEQHWRDNKPFESCVPEGTYHLVPFVSGRWGNTFALVSQENRVFAKKNNVENDGDRWACIIHTANRAGELQGCLAAGRTEFALNGEWAVSNSAETTRKLIDYIRTNNIEFLKITHYKAEGPDEREWTGRAKTGGKAGPLSQGLLRFWSALRAFSALILGR